MAELDQLLRDSFARVAEQTTTPARDSADIADLIRQRVASGDAGASATSATAPGWGGVGFAGVLGAIGVVAVVGVAGAALGVSGLLGRPVVDEVSSAGAVLIATADAHLCAGGEVIGTLPADTRVFATARSDDGAWVGVRNPSTLTATIWFPADLVVIDDVSGVGTLPTGGACPSFASAPVAPVPPVNAPVPVESAAPAPQPGPAPQPVPQVPSDTTPPTIGSLTANPLTVYNTQATTLTTAASDGVGVTGVLISWSGAHSGSGSMTLVGGQWTFTWSTTANTYGAVTFTARAIDAAGNQSGPSQVVVTHSFFG